MLFKIFRVNLTLKNEISILKIEDRAILFQDWFDFHSLERDSKKFKECT